jgi:hypothetical protein
MNLQLPNEFRGQIYNYYPLSENPYAIQFILIQRIFWNTKRSERMCHGSIDGHRYVPPDDPMLY